MKKILLLSLFVVSANFCICQKVITARYLFSHVRDTLQREKPYSERMILKATSTNSIYRSYELFVFDSLVRSGDDETLLKIPKATSEQIFTDFSKDEILVIRPFLGDTFAIRSSNVNIQWKVFDSTKNIGGLTCKMAIGMYKGRVYTCWYSPEISLRSGPWKLNGLPGLIIQAYDSKKEVVFELIDLRQDTKSFYIPKNMIATTENKYNDLINAFKANPGSFSGGLIDPNNLNIQKTGSNKAKSTLNNPLELQ